MKTLQELFDSFNIYMGNSDVKFMERFQWDWETTIFHLGYNPVSLVTAHKPIVTSNIGTVISPIYQELVENVDYTINYELGQIVFSTPPRIIENKNEYNVTVEAYHCKINLNHFVQFWNLCVPKVQLLYPRKFYKQIIWSDIGVNDNSYIESVDLTLPVFEPYNIEEVFQNSDSEKRIPMHLRENTLHFELDSNSDNMNFFYGPQDYTRQSVRWAKQIMVPFYIAGRYKYPKLAQNVDPNTLLSTDLKLQDEDGSTQWALYQIAYFMYEMRENWSERQNASTLRMSSMKDIQWAKMSISQSLMRHVMDTAPGRGYIPNSHYQ